MLVAARIKVECGRIRDVTACVIRYHRDVIADLILVRIAFEGIKRVAYCDIRRPRDTRVSAPGIE